MHGMISQTQLLEDDNVHFVANTPDSRSCAPPYGMLGAEKA
jgi:hypothetical protein